MNSGKFVWFDLMSTDPKASEDFYVGLFGWRVVPRDMGEMGVYRMLYAGDAGIGGIEASGGKTYWLGYVTDPDVDATVARVGQLGGKVVSPPMDIPGVGRFAVIADRQGASLAAMTFPQPAGDAPKGPGTFCWKELHTTDPADARRFWCAVFGWGAKDLDLGRGGLYHAVTRGEEQEGGVMRMHGAYPPHWLYYVDVADVDAMTARATSLGGNLFVGPSDYRGMGRFSVIADPQGGVIGLFKAGPGRRS